MPAVRLRHDPRFLRESSGSFLRAEYGRKIPGFPQFEADCGSVDVQAFLSNSQNRSVPGNRPFELPADDRFSGG